MNSPQYRKPDIQIDRVMVTLFSDIKRNLPQYQRDSLNIAAPDIGQKMLDLYSSSNDENIRLLTKVFLQRAGENWANKLTTDKI